MAYPLLLKKLSLGMGTLAIALSLNGGVVRADDVDDNLSLIKSEIMQKSDVDFDQYLTNFVEEAKKDSKDLNEIKSELSDLGIEFNAAPVTENPIGIFSNLPSDVTLTAYSARRGGEAYYRLYGSLTMNNSMTGDQGSLDLLSIEWDPKLASYYSYADEDNAGYNFTSLMDYNKKDEGGLAFNVEDTRMTKGSYTYAVAYVVPKAGTSGRYLQYGAKYIHTYDDKGVTWKINGNVAYEKGVTGGLTLELTPASTSKNFSVASQNAVQL